MTDKVNPQQGISDRFRIIRKSSGTDITSELGKIVSASYNINEGSERESHVNSGAEMTTNEDTLVNVEGEVQLRVPNFKVFRLMGSYEEFDSDGDGTNDSWRVDLTDALPEFELKLQVLEKSKDVVLHIYNVKFGEGEVNVDKNGFMTATFQYQACLSDSNNFFEFKDNTTISKPTPDGFSKRGFDSEFAIDGNAVGSGENFTFTYQRDLEADKGIEPNDGRPKRVPSHLIERLKDFSASGEVTVTDMEAFENVLDDTSYPLTVQDRRTEKVLRLGLEQSTAGFIEWSGAKLNPLSGELSNDAEKRTVNVDGNAIGATVEGSL